MSVSISPEDFGSLPSMWKWNLTCKKKKKKMQKQHFYFMFHTALSKCRVEAPVMIPFLGSMIPFAGATFVSSGSGKLLKCFCCCRFNYPKHFLANYLKRDRHGLVVEIDVYWCLIGFFFIYCDICSDNPLIKHCELHLNYIPL